MTDIVLGGLTLNPDLLWTNRFKYSPVAQATDRLLAGTLVVHNQSLQKGQPITLEANEETGWFTKLMIDQLVTWGAEPGKIMTLNYHDQESHQVMFNHEDPPALDFDFIVNRVPFVSTDYFTGTISLFTV